MNSSIFPSAKSLLHMVCMTKRLTSPRPRLWTQSHHSYGSRTHGMHLGRVFRERLTLCFATSTTMRVVCDGHPQVFQRDPQDTWALTAAVATEPHPCVNLLRKGCLWRATKRDDGPFNGSFHAPNECCRYCIIR